MWVISRSEMALVAAFCLDNDLRWLMFCLAVYSQALFSREILTRRCHFREKPAQSAELGRFATKNGR